MYKFIGFIQHAVPADQQLDGRARHPGGQLNKQKDIVVYLIATIALGACFFGAKVVEYKLDYDEHLWPAIGSNFEPKHALLGDRRQGRPRP